MEISNYEFRVVVDIDGTLVKKVFSKQETEISIHNPYDNIIYNYQVHHEHVQLIKRYKARGLFVEVWTADGVKHAESVVKALGLTDYVDRVSTKPIKCLDDKANLNDICGNRVFIPKEGWKTE